MNFSRTRIDKAGRALARDECRSEEEYFEPEDVFDKFRKLHLAPLSLTTLEIQNWLAAEKGEYCIAQLLKRKPQIVRKLERLNTTLSQLQGLGGLRIESAFSNLLSRPLFLVSRQEVYRAIQ